MTATEPHIAEPKRKRPLQGLTWGWVELLLALLTLLLMQSPFRPPADREFGISVLAAFAGSIVAVYMHRGGFAEALPRDLTGPWYYDGIACVLFALIGINLPHNFGEKTSCLCVASFAVAGICLTIMVWKFFRVRQQFTLRTLMLVALGVATVCGAWVYLPIVPLFVFLAIPALKWAKFGPPSLRRAKDGPKNLKSQIPDSKSQISDPKSAIQNPKSKI
jgi:hypothetical protein